MSSCKLLESFYPGCHENWYLNDCKTIEYKVKFISNKYRREAFAFYLLLNIVDFNNDDLFYAFKHNFNIRDKSLDHTISSENLNEIITKLELIELKKTRKYYQITVLFMADVNSNIINALPVDICKNIQLFI